MKVPEEYRTKKGMMASDESYGNNGAFEIPFESYILDVIASDGENWEHVSVSLKHRTPNWKEMSFIKELFWSDTQWVVQYHPAKEEYVNNHDNCLHLWNPLIENLPIPPSGLVGIKKEEL